MSKVLKFFVLSCIFYLSVYADNVADYRQTMQQRIDQVLIKLEENNYEHESDPGLKWLQGYYCGLSFCLNESYLRDE